MNLRTRIGITVLVIIIVPIIMTGTIFYVFTNYKVHSIGARYGIENPTFSRVYNSVELISRQIQEEYDKVRAVLEERPELVEDVAYLQSVNEDMADNAAFVVVRKEDSIFYNGSENITDESLLAMLRPYGRGANESGAAGGTYLQTQEQSMFKQLDVEFSDGAEGSLFLISPTDRILPEIRTWAVQMISFVILVLIVVSVVMGYWLSRGIVKPLGELKRAAQNVRDGNLDFTVEGSGVEELNDLCHDFEEMRVRLKESAEEKVAFDRESKELISNISHDLKTPLTTIRGYVEGVLDGVANTPEKLDRYMRTVSSKAGEMTHLLDELTLYSQIDTNRIPYTFARVKVEDCFTACADDLRIDLEEHGIDLTFSSNLEQGTEIIADADSLRRVINNIVGNAVKYMDKKSGKIAIRLRDAGDFVRAEIEDNGRGIARDELPRVFDRFYRTDASRNTKEGGSGIGLSIVRKIIEDHEGRVWANSIEGEGTTIFFTMRKYSEPESKADKKEVAEKETGRSRSRRRTERREKQSEKDKSGGKK